MQNDDRRKVGSIRSRGDRWQARVTVGVKSDGTRREATKSFATKGEAEQWLLERTVEMGKRPDLGASTSLGQVWALYESQESARLAKKTMGFVFPNGADKKEQCQNLR